jgi:hypothetical protein
MRNPHGDPNAPIPTLHGELVAAVRAVGRGGSMLVLAFPGFALILAGPGIVAWQCYTWLAVGTWPALSVRYLFDWYASTGWLGVDKIIDWCPASLFWCLVGWPLGSILVALWLAIHRALGGEDF